MSNNLVIVCVHVLKGQSVYHQTDEHILCKECFTHYNSYGYDKNGYWKIPKNEDFANLRTVCKSCTKQIVKNKLR